MLSKFGISTQMSNRIFGKHEMKFIFKKNWDFKNLMSLNICKFIKFLKLILYRKFKKLNVIVILMAFNLISLYSGKCHSMFIKGLMSTIKSNEDLHRIPDNCHILQYRKLKRQKWSDPFSNPPSESTMFVEDKIMNLNLLETSIQWSPIIRRTEHFFLQSQS